MASIILNIYKVGDSIESKPRVQKSVRISDDNFKTLYSMYNTPFLDDGDEFMGKYDFDHMDYSPYVLIYELLTNLSKKVYGTEFAIDGIEFSLQNKTINVHLT